MVKVVVRVWSFSRRNKHRDFALLESLEGMKMRRRQIDCIYQSILGEFISLINYIFADSLPLQI